MRRIEEIVRMTVKFPKANVRAEKAWNLDNHPELTAAIDKCLATGEPTEYVGDFTLYRIEPRFPLVEEAMKDPKNKSLLKVSITVFTPAFHLGVHEVQ